MKITELHRDPIITEMDRRAPSPGVDQNLEADESVRRSVQSLEPDQGIRRSVEDAEEIDLLDLLIVLARRKRMILAATVGTAVIAAVVSFLLPNRYIATTKILPPMQAQSASSMVMNQLAGAGMGSLAVLAGGSLGLKNPSDIYIGMLKSRSIADGLIGKFDLLRVYRDKHATDARKDLANYSDIAAEKEGLISISVEDKDPKRAAAMANAYVDELRNVTQHLAISEASQRRLFFEQQMKQAKDDMSNAEVALKETEQKTGMIQLDSQAKAVIEAIGNIRAQIAAKEVQLQAMRSYATEQNPQYIVTEQQLSGLHSQLSKLESQTGGGEGDPIVSTSKVPGIALEYVRKYRDVKYYETIFDLLAKQYEAAKIDESRESAVIQVVDPAIEPDRKTSPRCLLIIAVCTICGLMIGCVLSLLTEALERLHLDPGRANQLSRLMTSLNWRRRERFVVGGR